jgi:hypothetical protein
MEACLLPELDFMSILLSEDLAHIGTGDPIFFPKYKIIFLSFKKIEKQ